MWGRTESKKMKQIFDKGIVALTMVFLTMCSQVPRAKNTSCLIADIPAGRMYISIANREGCSYRRPDKIILKENDEYIFRSYIPSKDITSKIASPISIMRNNDQIIVSKMDGSYQFRIINPGHYSVRCDPSADDYPKIRIYSYLSPKSQIQVNTDDKTEF